MTGRWKFWLITAIVAAIVAAAIYIPILRRRMRRAARQQQLSEEQARRELIQPVPLNPGDPRVKTKLFWLSDSDESTLAPVVVELPLSNDPVLRSKQVLNTLLAGPVDSELRTLPPDAVLLAFYILPDGTAIADFSEALGTSIPSGIVSEQLAVDSMARTLEANVPPVQRLKILIHGQEMETLAGHVDLTGTFLVNTKLAQPPSNPVPATSPSPAAAPTALTPDAGPGKLAQPATKP
ncbi:MAG TPA: GerMN domain-containing protein [Candidatus Angelobacter sp.]|nr:GerMN domain-containing protein [Candidatus Angelobacter sp.]